MNSDHGRLCLFVVSLLLFCFCVPHRCPPSVGNEMSASSSSSSNSCSSSTPPSPTCPSNWPIPVIDVLFGFLDLGTLRNCSLVCKRWSQFLCDGQNDVWRLHCVRRLAAEALKSELLSTLPSYKAKLRAFYHSWNPEDCSRYD